MLGNKSLLVAAPDIEECDEGTHDRDVNAVTLLNLSPVHAMQDLKEIVRHAVRNLKLCLSHKFDK